MAEILEDLEQGQTHWAKLFKRLGPFFKEKLGVLWEDERIEISKDLLLISRQMAAYGGAKGQCRAASCA